MNIENVQVTPPSLGTPYEIPISREGGVGSQGGFPIV